MPFGEINSGQSEFCLGFLASLDCTYVTRLFSHILFLSVNRVWNHELNRRRNGQKARLWITIPKIYWWRFFLLGILHFIIVSACNYYKVTYLGVCK